MSLLIIFARNKHTHLFNGSSMFTANILKRGLYTGLQTLQQIKPGYSIGQHQTSYPKTNYHGSTEMWSREFISHRLFMKNIEQFKTTGNMTSSEALFMLRSCGDQMVFLSAELRQIVTNDTWSLINQCNVPLDVSHFNSLLQAFIDNKTPINVAEITQSLKDKNVKPNRITYAKFINDYCQRGDTEGANSILSIMNEEKLPIDESIFNSLIIGNARAHDLEGALQVVDIMKQKQMVIDRSTLDCLLMMYSELNKLPEAMQIIDEAEQDKIAISAKALFEAYANFMMHDNKQAVDKIVAILPKSQSVKLVVPVFKKFIAAQKYDDAFNILNFMDISSPSVAHHIVDILNDYKISYDVHKKFCQKFPSIEGSDIHTFIAKRMFTLEDSDTIQQFPITEGKVIQSILQLDATKQTFEDDLVQLLAMGNKRYTLYTAALQVLDLSDPVKVFDSLNAKLPLDKYRPAAFIVHCLANCKIEEALQIAIKYGKGFATKEVAQEIFNYFILTGKADGVAKIMLTTGAMINILKFIANQLSSKEQPEKTMLVLLQEMEKLGINILESETHFLKEHSNIFASEEVYAALSKLTTMQASPELIELQDQMMHAHKQRDIGFKKKQDQLIKFYMSNDLQNTNKIYKEICPPFQPSDHHVKMGVMHYKHGKIGEAYNCFQRAFKYNSKMLLRSRQKSTIMYISVLLRLGKLNDLHLYISLLGPFFEEHTYLPSFLSDIGRIVESPEKAQLIEMMLNNNILQRKDVPSINCYADMYSNNLLGAMQKLEEFHDYPDTELVVHFYMECIRTEQPQIMQKFHNHLITMKGKIDAIHILGFAFLKCDKLKQAQHLFQSLGNRLSSQYFKQQAYLFGQETSVENMENLLKVSQDLDSKTRALLYKSNIFLHMKIGKPQQALEVWTNMQDENLQLDDNFVRNFATFLANSNVEVPFVVPKHVDETFGLPSISRTVSLAPSRYKQEDINNLMEKLEQILGNGEEFEKIKKDFSDINDSAAIDQALQNILTGENRQQIFDVIAAKDIQIKFKPIFLQAMYDTYADQNELNVYFEKMINLSINKIGHHHRPAYFNTLTNCLSLPECVEQLEKASSEGNITAHSTLWNYYMMEDRNEEANLLFEKCKSYVSISHTLIDKKYKNGQLHTLVEVVSEFDSTKKERTSAYLLNYIIKKLLNDSSKEEIVQFMIESKQLFFQIGNEHQDDIRKWLIQNRNITIPY